MKGPVELNEETARALRMLGQAAPPEGMEARLAGRLRQRRAEWNAAGASRLSISSGWMVFAGVLVAACVMVAVLMGHRDNVAVKHAAVVAADAVPPASPQVVASAPAYRVVGTTRRTRNFRAPVKRNPVSFPAPEVPLTEQEKILVAIVQSPRSVAGLGSVATSETVADHGLGENSIFELDHEELAQLKTTLQPAPLKNTLPQPNRPGDIE